MVAALERIVEKALERLSDTITTYLPPLLAGLIILLAAYVLAVLVRWLLNRIFKGTGLDRFLHQSGLSAMFGRSGRVRTTRLVSGAAYWAILGLGFLTALSAFNTALTSRMIETMVFLLPKLVTAAAIILIGAWLGHYVGRSTLIWACNEGIPSPRRWAGAVRIVINFVAVVVAADHLDFARSVFLASFVLLVGGAVLATAIALGLGAKDAVRRYFYAEKAEIEEIREPSLWNHL
jgi:small-conductance mechanosensitive channel